MRKLMITMVLAGLVVSLQAQQSETRTVSPFTGVKVSEGIDVYLKQGNKEALKIEASGIDLSDVVTEVSGGYLKIHIHGDYGHRNRTVKVYATYVSVNKLSASSAAGIFHEGILKTSELNLTASSAANIELKIESKSVDAGASSAGEIRLEGNVERAVFDASSAGEIDAYNLEASVAEAECSSGGSIKLTVKDELKAEASSGGSIRYRGSPSKSVTNASSGGSVRKSN